MIMAKPTIKRGASNGLEQYKVHLALFFHISPQLYLDTVLFGKHFFQEMRGKQLISMKLDIISTIMVKQWLFRCNGRWDIQHFFT